MKILLMFFWLFLTCDAFAGEADLPYKILNYDHEKTDVQISLDDGAKITITVPYFESRKDEILDMWKTQREGLAELNLEPFLTANGHFPSYIKKVNFDGVEVGVSYNAFDHSYHLRAQDAEIGKVKAADFGAGVRSVVWSVHSSNAEYLWQRLSLFKDVLANSIVDVSADAKPENAELRKSHLQFLHEQALRVGQLENQFLKNQEKPFLSKERKDELLSIGFNVDWASKSLGAFLRAREKREKVAEIPQIVRPIEKKNTVDCSKMLQVFAVSTLQGT